MNLTGIERIDNYLHIAGSAVKDVGAHAVAGELTCAKQSGHDVDQSLAYRVRENFPELGGGANPGQESQLPWEAETSCKLNLRRSGHGRVPLRLGSALMAVQS